MVLGITTIVCIAVFVVSAFALRYRMHELSAIYEAETAALLAAEVVLLDGGAPPDVREIERKIRSAAEHSRVMRRNAALFRLLWPEEYDRTFRAAQRLIAQSSRMAALASR